MARRALDLRMGDRRRRDLNYSRGRGGRPLERAKARVYATETHCFRCNRPVDMTLPYRDPVTGRVNRWAKSYDHPIELDRNADPYSGHLAHIHCNLSAGASYGNRKRAKSAGTDTSHDWS